MKNWKINFCPSFTSSFTSFYTYIIIYIAFYSKTWFLSIIYIIIYIIIYLHQYLHHILQQNLSFKFTWFFTLIPYCNSYCLFNSIYTSKFTYNPKIINRKNGCTFSEINNYYREIFVKINFFHAWKYVISRVKYRSKFWHLRRKPAVIFLKWVFLQNFLLISWAI